MTRLSCEPTLSQTIMKHPKDNRRFPRAVIMLSADIHDSDKRLAVEVVDLGVHGIAFKLDRPLSVGEEIFIAIHESEAIRHNELKAEILRCDPLKGHPAPRYLAAAKFVDVNDEYLMDSLALVHGKPGRS